MPSPLRSKTELEMWRLAAATRCENCNKLGTCRDTRSSPEDPWRAGPGHDGVAIIWPFAIALCGSCVLLKAVKEIDLLFSSSVPSAVIPALPSVILTQEFHIVSPSTVEQGPPPGDLKVTKIFLSTDVVDIQAELESVKLMGPGAFEEWLKGLEGRRSLFLNDAAKWQRWETTGEPRLKQTHDNGSNSVRPTSISSEAQNAVSETEQGIQGDQLNSKAVASSVPRQPRSQQEATMLKSARAAEIERRCQLLDPFLPPNVLRHIPAFQAAVQITTPLDDTAWEVLKPRLVAQRPEAEKREQEAATPAQEVTKEAGEVPRRLESTLATTKEARDLIDKQWEEVQEPLRVRIVGYADEFVRDNWDDGRKVTRENCSRFAAEALVCIRARFYADTAKDIEAAKASGKPLPPDSPKGPFTQKLTLENMKWIFDSKIKPFTEPHRKELFFCNACEGNMKAYGFEGVVQHYAAKHTNALSLGSIVVHWRAEWPEIPPFNPEGRSRRPSTAAQRNQTGYQSYPPGSGSMPSQMPPYPATATPGYGVPPYGDQYHQPLVHPSQPYMQPGHYPPPHGYGSHPYQPPSGPFQPYRPPPPQSNGQYSHPMGPDPSHPYQVYPPASYPPPSPALSGPSPGAPPLDPAPAQGQYSYSYRAYPSNPHAPPPPSGYSQQYPAQLEFLVRNSREVWQALSNIKDLPGSARVFATIHHVVKRYRSRFSETPPLSMFIDGLSNNKDMRPVRNINGLTCKACELRLGNGGTVEKEAQHVSLPKLANHFQSKHIELIQQVTPDLPPLDWVNDMVLLVGHHAISNLRSTVASDSQKSYLLSDAFPEAFNPPQQTPDTYQQAQQTYHSQLQLPAGGLPPSVDNHGMFYGGPAPQGAKDGGADMENAPYASTSQPQDHVPGYDPKEPNIMHETNRQKASHHNQKKGNGKNKGGKNNKAAEAARRVTEEDDKTAEEEARREENEIRAMWATDRATTARAATSSTRPEDEGSNLKATSRSSQPGTSGGNTPRHHRKAPSKKSTPLLVENEAAPSLMDALELHLGQGHSSSARTQPPPLAQPAVTSRAHPYQDESRHHFVEDTRPGDSPGQGRYAINRDQDKFPSFDDRYWSGRQQPEHRQSQGTAPQRSSARPDEITNRTSPYGAREPPRYDRPAQPDAVSHRAANHRPAGPATHQAYEHYSQPPNPSDSALGRRPPREDVYYSQAQRRQEEITYDRAPPTEYYRHLNESHGPSRGAVQEYEIVQVIDDRGEYFIRRPVVRREPEPYYYEDRGPARRVSEPYPRYEPVYSRGPPPPAGYEAVHVPPTRTGSQRQPIPHDPGPAPAGRGDPAYYEPYDPHDPTAAIPAPRPQYQRQKVYYGD